MPSTIINERLNTVLQTLKPIQSDSIEDINATIQLKLRETVNRLGWSDLEVAKRAGLPQATVYRLLNKKTISPSFALVVKLCQTIGLSLPYSSGQDFPKRPIDFLIGPFLSNIPESAKNTQWVNCLPELQSYKIGKVMNGCANLKYPKGTLLFFNTSQDGSIDIKPNDVLLIKISDKTSNYKLVPMAVLEHPVKGRDMPSWVLHHLTSQKSDQFIINMNTDGEIGCKKDLVFKVFGKVQRAII